ncbi:hypothetical protein GOL32_12270 [Sinorhizobium medicae]|nr:hypothetical protein [Sinorhizobium medicae]
MNTHRQTAHDIARETIVAFRDMTPEDRAAKLSSLTITAQKSPTANSIRGQALIRFWDTAAHAVALDTEHMAGSYTGTTEGHGNMREAAMVASGDALLAYVVSIIPVSVAGLLAGEAAPV